MAYRLVIRIGDRSKRFPLEPGENLVGSCTECAVRISHPTVSRRHAAITVSDQSVSLTDLGSRNGTRVGGRAVTDSVTVAAGAGVRIGSVEGRLEEVGVGDVEVGISLPAPELEPSRVPRGADSFVSTVTPAALEVFAVERFPELAEGLARGDSRTEIAQAAAAALRHAMPCRRVEVVRDRGDAEELLFASVRTGGSGTPGREIVAADAGDGWILRVDFLSPAFARSYAPLVRGVAALVRAAGPRAGVKLPRGTAAPDLPEPPRPPSLVRRMLEIYSLAGRIAGGRVSVLIKGESGTGKELLARYVHAASERAGAELVTLNCAALPRDLLESELFGVERGVATGVEARAGKFESAHGSTLFLDEIGDMAAETQAKILRVLQEGEVHRIGGSRARPADVRVLSATNRELDAMLEDGRFRRDLYHRIADWVVEVPPLRQRRADIPNLAAHFLAEACDERGLRVAGISRDAVAALVSYAWPGNIRELQKEMRRVALFLDDEELLDTARLQAKITRARTAGSGDALKDVLERAEREHIVRVLDECGGVVTEAAERLAMGLSTLYRRMKALGIE
ncbi:MAG: sigma 54-dependent Fis family transcriptional regulator [bacterium]|nr:sigma 54-dependent Fis family transcriptional regulator [bacterium]